MPARPARLIAVAVAAVLVTGACGSGDESSGSPYRPPGRSDITGVPVTPKARPQPRETTEPQQRTAPREKTEPPAGNGAVRVHGRVVYAGSGRPYAGAWVEFKNVWGENVHTTTDGNGYYALPVPEGVYTALAGDEPDADLDFSVSNRSGNAVSVPPDTVVDFVVTAT